MSGLLHQVALVSESNSVSFAEVAKVAAALQKQSTRDFGPVWGIDATVDPFEKLDQVPLGYWPIIVRDDIKTPGAAGVHKDDNGQPLALVMAGAGWSLTASHECLEMLADPWGNRIVAGNSPKKGQGRVEFLVEVSDPSEDARYSYSVNGLKVSDFYTPHYFDPELSPGVRYSFTGAITRPRQVLKGGYLSWHEPVSDHWWQEVWFGNKATFRDLGVLGRLTGSLREAIDMRTPESERVLKTSFAGGLLTAAAAGVKTADAASAARAKALSAVVRRIKQEN